MIRGRALSTLALAFAVGVGDLCAQGAHLAVISPGENARITLHDGSVLYGKMVRQDADSIVIMAIAGRTAVPVASVREVRNAGEAHVAADGSVAYWPANANTTRLFFGPTGRTLAAGDGYFADHEVVLASVGLGITDRVQLGVGSLIVPNSRLWVVFPKVGVVQSEHVNVAVGALYGGVDSDQGGVGYAVGTWGTIDQSLTLGLGEGISGTKMAGKPVYMVGGETRTSARTALVTENYFGAGSSDGLLMYGMRFLGDRFTVDLAFMNTTRNPLFPGIPYVDFVIRW